MLSTSLLFNPCDSGSYYISTNVTTWSPLTFNSTTTISGTYTKSISPITPLVPCYYANGTTQLFIENAVLHNCECCNIVVKTPRENNQFLQG